LGGLGEYLGILAVSVPLVLWLCIAFVLMGLLLSKRTYGRVALFVAIAIVTFLLAPAFLYLVANASERREILGGPGAPSLLIMTFTGLTIIPFFWLGKRVNANRNKRFN